MLRDLVISFDCDSGHTLAIYNHAKNLLADMLGEDAAQIFSRWIDASEGMFYLKRGFGIQCWENICDSAKNPES